MLVGSDAPIVDPEAAVGAGADAAVALFAAQSSPAGGAFGGGEKTAWVDGATAAFGAERAEALVDAMVAVGTAQRRGVKGDNHRNDHGDGNESAEAVTQCAADDEQDDADGHGQPNPADMAAIGGDGRSKLGAEAGLLIGSDIGGLAKRVVREFVVVVVEGGQGRMGLCLL